jgi:hypothetical protein
MVYKIRGLGGFLSFQYEEIIEEWKKGMLEGRTI